MLLCRNAYPFAPSGAWSEGVLVGGIGLVGRGGVGFGMVLVGVVLVGGVTVVFVGGGGSGAAVLSALTPPVMIVAAAMATAAAAIPMVFFIALPFPVGLICGNHYQLACTQLLGGGWSRRALLHRKQAGRRLLGSYARYGCVCTGW